MYNNAGNTIRHGNADPVGLKVAQGLGWFSITLGALELFATRKLTRSLGMRGNEALIGLYGLREITMGIGILMSKDPTPWVWGRVLGDALDTGTLAQRLNGDNRKAANVAMALGSVALATAADIYCAHKLSYKQVGRSGDRERYDYSDRSGLREGSQAVGEQSATHVASATVPQQA